MGTMARERAVTKFSAERMIRNYEALYSAAHARSQEQAGSEPLEIDSR